MTSIPSVAASFAERLRAHPLRSALTILSIAVGSALLALSLNLGLRLDEAYRKTVSDLDGLFAVFNGTITADGGDTQYQFPFRFEAADPALIASEVPGVRCAAALSYFSWSRILVGDAYYVIRATLAAGPEIKDVFNLATVAGTFLSDDDQRGVVVSEAAAKALFGGAAAAVGKSLVGSVQNWERNASGVWVRNGYRDDTYGIVGVFADPAPMRAMALNLPDFIVPLAVARPDRGFTHIVASIDPEAFSSVRENVVKLLARRHGEDTQLQAWKGSWVRPPRDGSGLASSLKNSMTAMAVFFGALGFIALLVAGFGISSIMMVGILERTREIGLRRAIGCTKPGIVGMFMAESFLMLGIGAVIGVGLAFPANLPILKALMGMFNMSGRVAGIDVLASTAISPLALVYGAGVTLVVGLLFALYPSLTATRISPVECLREE